MYLALWIIFLLLGLADFGYSLYLVIYKVRSHGEGSDQLSKKDYIYMLTSIGSVGIFTYLFFLFLGQYLGYVFTPLEMTALVFGGYFFGTLTTLFIDSFILYFYKKTLINPPRNYQCIVMVTSGVCALISLFLLSEGYANHLTYPLVEGISIGDFHVQFYGILIVSGAVLVYFICDHRFYKRFNQHGILDPIFLIAFPMGIVGARLWYCLVLDPEIYLKDPISIFKIWEGGLAIQGGALMGIAFGVGAMLLFRKYVNIRWAMDIIVPTILIAQAIGRWGNFFNHEVFGYPVDATYWQWLPTIIYNQMSPAFSAGVPTFSTSEFSNVIQMPLFLIEGCTNFVGYFIIRYVFGHKLRKILSLGDLTGGYLIWYGITRVIMEPLRDGQFEYSQSFFTAIAFIVGGVLFIVAMHIYDFIRKKKGLEPRTWETV